MGRGLNAYIDCGIFPITPEEIEENKQLELDDTAEEIGTYMAIFGTLIWAYGDLVGEMPRLYLFFCQ